MDDALAKDEPIIYISLGSEVDWQQWYIDAFYNGVLKLRQSRKMRVIWALKTEGMKLPDGYDTNVFWVGSWLPQIELLAHPALKAGVIHCGLGGTFEFINSGVPCLLFPHFGDQGQNGRNLRDAGAGIALMDLDLGDRNFEENKTTKFESPLFTADDVCKKFDEILKNPKYAENMMKMKIAAVAAGGGERAVQAIEDFFVSCLTLKPG